MSRWDLTHETIKRRRCESENRMYKIQKDRIKKQSAIVKNRLNLRKVQQEKLKKYKDKWEVKVFNQKEQTRLATSKVQSKVREYFQEVEKYNERKEQQDK